MRAIYLFPALLGACLVLLGSSVSLQAQDGPTPPNSTDAPIDPIDEQPPQGPNNPPQPPANPPAEICGIETDKIECKWPYDLPPRFDHTTVLRNQKCKIRGRCVRNRFTGNYDCKDIDDQFILDEYEGTTTLIKDIKQIVEAPNAPDKKLYEKTEKVCYTIYECDTECRRIGHNSYVCQRGEKKEEKKYFEYKWKGDCPPNQPNPNPNPDPGPPKPEIGPDLN